MSTGRWVQVVSVAVVVVLTAVAVVMATGADVDPLPDVPGPVAVGLSVLLNALVWWRSRRERRARQVP